MTRPLRIDYPDSFYHVLSRGNERRPVFFEQGDYRRFLELIGRTSEKYHVQIHAYVLMQNHYHLLVKTRQANLSRAIQWLGVSYAGWINRKYKRSGHLFQGRFKSFLIEDEQYFITMCYYVHGNPVRAGLVKDAAAYEWSSAGGYAEEAQAAGWLTTDLLLGICSGDRTTFCREQEAYLDTCATPLDNLRHGLYLGGEEFAHNCLGRAAEHPQGRKEMPQLRQLLKSRNKEDLIRTILKALNEADTEGILAAKRRQRPARDVCIYVLTHMGVYSHSEIAEVFDVGYTAITGSIQRARRFLHASRQLKAVADEITSSI